MGDMELSGSGSDHRPEPDRDAPRGSSVPELLRFLTRVSRRLSEPEDYEATLRAVAGQALPYLGSWCIVDLVDPDGTLRRLAVVHSDPRMQEHATHLEGGWPPDHEDPLGLPRAMVTRRSEIIADVDEAMLVRVARNEENLRHLRALGIGSVIVTPLLARGEVIGAMTFVGADAGRSYRGSDVQLAEDIAARCAIAVDRARLLEEAERAHELAVLANERLVLASLHEKEVADEAVAERKSATHFIAAVSHEVRTPLSAILGYVSLLTEGVAGGLTQTQQEHLERIREAAKHLMDLLADILDLEKARGGRLHLELKEGELGRVVSEALGMIHPIADRAGVTVEHTPSDEEVRYVGDEERVRQILLNLLVNAVKFTDSGGKVRATSGSRERADPEAVVSRGGPWIFVEVEDTGIGIPERRREEVFDPFVQLEGASARSKGGAGLGLHISRDLARRMGGDVTVRSREGEGSHFTLWLPAA